MAPAFARRTPQPSHTAGRPKRQAALNRKETPGAPKKKEAKEEKEAKDKTENEAKKTTTKSQTKATAAKRSSPRKAVSPPVVKEKGTSQGVDVKNQKGNQSKAKAPPKKTAAKKAPVKKKNTTATKKRSNTRKTTAKKEKKEKVEEEEEEEEEEEKEVSDEEEEVEEKKDEDEIEEATTEGTAEGTATEEDEEDAKDDDETKDNVTKTKLEEKTSEKKKEDVKKVEGDDDGEESEDEKKLSEIKKEVTENKAHNKNKDVEEASKDSKKNVDVDSDQSDNSEDEIDDGELEDDEDEDFDPDNDPDKLWCFCRQPHNNRFMICCDVCEDWFHGDCVGITMKRGREMEKTGEEWCCKQCQAKQLKSADDSLPLKSPLNSPLVKKDEVTIKKARSLSLDSMKNNLAKLKDRKLSISENKLKEEEEEESGDVTDSSVSTSEGKTTEEKGKQRSQSIDEKNSKDKLKKEKPKVELPGFTFVSVPTAKKEERKDSTEKVGRKRSSTDRRDSTGHEDEVKRKHREPFSSKHKPRTTPTPKNMEPIKRCIREECNRAAMKSSVYCSRECIYKYSNEAIKTIEHERKKKVVASPDSKTGTIISPATSSTDRVMETTQERIAVYEKATGKIVAGVMAPTKKYLFAWLEEHPSYEVLKQGKEAEVKHPKKDLNEVVRNNVRKSLRDILINRCKETMMAINLEAVGQISKKIEHELLKLYGETGQKYKTKYRSLIFNLKDPQNKILYKRVVSGEIMPRQIVHMSPEDLATPELAQWREKESKHHIELVKKREQEAAELAKHTIIKKTYKGEIEIEGENTNASMVNLELRANPEPEPERKRSTSTSSDIVDVKDLLKDTTDEHAHHLFDSNCRICTGKEAPPGENNITGVSTTVVQTVAAESSLPSPEDMELSSPSSPPSPDTSVPVLSPSPSPTPVPTPAPPPSARKQPSVWRGFVMMQKVAKFVCTAYAVSGTCENLMEILPDTIHICGRIPPNQVWEYLSQMREGRKNQNRFIDVIRFEMSSNEEKAGYIKLYSYFYTRERIGVVGNCYSGVKDMYILPLASNDPIPPELKPLPGLPKPRPHMLLGIIVRIMKPVVLKKKLSDPVTPQESSSSEASIPPKKKKKKKEKKLKELEKDRVEVEAQKKLLDIIFKNRVLAAATGGEGSETVTAPMDPAAILKSLTEKNNEVKDPRITTAPSVTDDESSIDFKCVTDDQKKLEEEQLQRLQEQQAEIERLKQEIGSSSVAIVRLKHEIDTTSPTESTLLNSNQDNALESASLKSIKDNASEDNVPKSALFKSITDNAPPESALLKSIKDNAPESALLKSIQDNLLKPDDSAKPNEDGDETNSTEGLIIEDISESSEASSSPEETFDPTDDVDDTELYTPFAPETNQTSDADTTVVTTLASTTITETMTSYPKFSANSTELRVTSSASDQISHKLSTVPTSSVSSTSGSPTKSLSSSYKSPSKVEIPFMSSTDDEKVKVSAAEPQVKSETKIDDYVASIINDIKIPVSLPKFPLEFMKGEKLKKDSKMPELPVINLPHPLELPLPGEIPKVPLPPNIKLPPGVPFPPLPPKPPKPLDLPVSIHLDTPQSPPDSRRGNTEIPSDPRRAPIASDPRTRTSRAETFDNSRSGGYPPERNIPTSERHHPPADDYRPRTDPRGPGPLGSGFDRESRRHSSDREHGSSPPRQGYGPSSSSHHSSSSHQSAGLPTGGSHHQAAGPHHSTAPPHHHDPHHLSGPQHPTGRRIDNFEEPQMLSWRQKEQNFHGPPDRTISHGPHIRPGMNMPGPGRNNNRPFPNNEYQDRHPQVDRPPLDHQQQPPIDRSMVGGPRSNFPPHDNPEMNPRNNMPPRFPPNNQQNFMGPQQREDQWQPQHGRPDMPPPPRNMGHPPPGHRGGGPGRQNSRNDRPPPDDWSRDRQDQHRGFGQDHDRGHRPYDDGYDRNHFPTDRNEPRHDNRRGRDRNNPSHRNFGNRKDNHGDRDRNYNDRGRGRGQGFRGRGRGPPGKHKFDEGGRKDGDKDVKKGEPPEKRVAP